MSKYFFNFDFEYFIIKGGNQNTKIMVAELSNHLWIAHFKRISDFMVCGEGVWWVKDGMYIIFKDGDDEEESRKEGPSLMDCRTSIHEVNFIIKLE